MTCCTRQAKGFSTHSDLNHDPSSCSLELVAHIVVLCLQRERGEVKTDFDVEANFYRNTGNSPYQLTKMRSHLQRSGSDSYLGINRRFGDSKPPSRDTAGERHLRLTLRSKPGLMRPSTKETADEEEEGRRPATPGRPLLTPIPDINWGGSHGASRGASRSGGFRASSSLGTREISYFDGGRQVRGASHSRPPSAISRSLFPAPPRSQSSLS